jgi:hypothetical protein
LLLNAHRKNEHDQPLPLSFVPFHYSYAKALDKVASTPLEKVTPENTLLLLADIDAEVRWDPEQLPLCSGFSPSSEPDDLHTLTVLLRIL